MELHAVYFLIAGVAFALWAWLWFLRVAFHTHKAWGWFLLLFPPTILLFLPLKWKRARAPLGLLLLAGVLLCSAFVMAKWENRITFGPRERVVDGELHVTLTDWNRTDYESLENRPEIVVLQMGNPDVTDETLIHLKGMTLLKELDLSRTQITDEGLALLAQLPRLQILRLRATAITDEGFRRHLFDKESLRELDLQETKVASKTVREWKAAQEGRKALR